MKIGISCNRFGKGGGMERYALDLARGWIVAGQRPAIFARRFDDVPERSLVDTHRISVSWLPGKLRDYVFSWQMRAAHRHCDVLIGCNRAVGADIAVCGGTHRGYLLHTGKKPTFWDQRQIGLERGFYRAASAVVAHSRLMQEELIDLYALPADKIVLLYPPVDTTRFYPASEEQRQALRRRFGFGDEIVLLFPSSDHRRKGLAILADGVARSGINAVLAVAGRAAGAKGRQIRELGYVDHMEDLYRAADFTVLASSYEPFGLVGVESVLSGTPAVLADSCGCLEILGPEAAQRFARNDPISLVRALQAAAEWHAAGNARIGDPLKCLGYDPSLTAHLQALHRLADMLVTSKDN